MDNASKTYVSNAPRDRARTVSVRAGIATETQHGAVVPPIYLSSNYTFSELGTPRRYDYTRSGNPTRDELGDALAKLEGGAGGVITATGLAAITTVLHLVPSGGTVVAPHDCYGGTYRLLNALSTQGRFRCLFVDQTNSSALDNACAEGVDLVWIETPSNPLLRITNIADVARRGHTAGARVVVDNTFLTPALQRPLDFGADIVVHSTTKYINGHSDVVGGAIVPKTTADHDQLAWWANCLGVTGSPFDSYLTLRGLRSLFARLTVHQANARELVELLRASPVVDRVYYPGLKEHSGHWIAGEQQRGYGAMISFELAGNAHTDALHPVRTFVDSLRHFSLAESLGGVESLIAHPATMTHAAMDPAARQRAGISDRLLRLSVGIEDRADLVQDVQQGLRRVEVEQKRLRAA